jgi:hypothetical protein
MHLGENNNIYDILRCRKVEKCEAFARKNNPGEQIRTMGDENPASV